MIIDFINAEMNHISMNKKGFISPRLTLLILATILVTAGVYFYSNGSLANVLSAKDENTGLVAQKLNTITPNTETFIEIQASGKTVGSEPPKIALDIKGEQVMYTFVSDRSTSYNYTFRGASLKPEDVRVRFMNDYTDRQTQESRDVRIDYIKINGVKYESEHESVFSTGTWSKGEKCNGGYKKSDWLHCNGYFQYASLDTGYNEISYQRLTDSLILSNQTFSERDARYEGKYAQGYVFRVKKNIPYTLHVTDYYEKYGTSEYIETYLFDSNKNLITSAQTNLPIREGSLDLRDPYNGISPSYEGDIYIIITNKFNDVRAFDVIAYDELNLEPVLLARDFAQNRTFNLSALSAFNKKYSLPIKEGTLMVDLHNDATIMMDPSLEVKVYTLEGTYFEHMQQYIEDGTYSYRDAKNYGREIPVTVVKNNLSTFEIYTMEKRGLPRPFAGPIEFPRRSQIQVVYEFGKSQSKSFERSMTFWTE